MVEVWSWLRNVLLTRRGLGEVALMEKKVEEWCFSSRETIPGDGNAAEVTRLADRGYATG
jgi:hypothetical protein